VLKLLVAAVRVLEANETLDVPSSDEVLPSGLSLLMHEIVPIVTLQKRC
jgi:hypothetical protein